MDFDTIAALRKYLTIKHSLPGRVRVKFSADILKDPEARKIAEESPDLPTGVKKTSLNYFSKTLLIEYDASFIDPALLTELITTDDDARAKAIVKNIHTVLYG